MQIKKSAPSSEIFFLFFLSADNQLFDTKHPYLIKNIFFECFPAFQVSCSFTTHI